MRLRHLRGRSHGRQKTSLLSEFAEDFLLGWQPKPAVIGIPLVNEPALPLFSASVIGPPCLTSGCRRLRPRVYTLGSHEAGRVAQAALAQQSIYGPGDETN